ncbi:hypothetical protein H5410_012972 [Solanum commersonii]|uniref:Uncharacterized protein n=1 Tax=Solanum commersonii TaxID=4109 RepID=A0A9J6AU60_SOLCO|nr:hypothetical protein H5410_012972 [Solanum commersonii]
MVTAGMKIEFYERKRHTHWSSCTNMNVFADLLTFLGQERFQQSYDIMEKQRKKMAISESEVTGTVASKFGGPRIAK